MFLLGNLINGIAIILQMVLSIYMWIIIIRALISWVNPDPYNQIVVFLYRATEPVLYRVRKHLPIGGIGIDISPIVVILLIYFFQAVVVKSLFDLAALIMK
jgi:YggT family protein